MIKPFHIECTNCNGSGLDHTVDGVDDVDDCPECDGGRILVAPVKPCSECGWTNSEYEKSRCKNCKDGWVIA